ncbi:MAG: tRNA (guanine-N1)-methyltransferase [Flavobacteriales bacterium]
MKRFKKAGTCFFVFFVITISGQITKNEGESKVNLNNGTVEQRIDYLISSSNNYQDYKVVKKTALSSIKKTVLDTIKGLESSLVKSTKIINEKAKEIETLQVDLNKTNEDLKQVRDEKDSFSFFGILIAKNLYSIILWGTIAGLLAGLFIVFGMFKRANSITAKTKKDFVEVEEEFERHRKFSLEREQKVKRELQDYKNKEKYKSKQKSVAVEKKSATKTTTKPKLKSTAKTTKSAANTKPESKNTKSKK